MSARWVAGSVRARAARRRRLGSAAARSLAGQTYDEALVRLSAGPYGHDVRPGQDVLEAQRCVGATLLWDLRVLAGWLPREGGEALRVLGGWFEVANVDGHLRSLAGEAAPAPYALGTLATAWPRLAATTTREQLRDELAASPWGDPGAGDDRSVQLAMRLSLARRVAAGLPAAAAWAQGAAVLLLSREVLVRRLPLGDPAARTAQGLLGTEVSAVGSLDAFRAAVPVSARWVLDGVAGPAQLWEAEVAWWRRVERDATALSASSRFGLEPVLGAAALLAVDAWRVRAALGACYRGEPAPGALDALV